MPKRESGAKAREIAERWYPLPVGYHIETLAEARTKLAAEIQRAIDEAVEQAIRVALEALVRDCAVLVETKVYGCTCGPDYTERKMTAPDCWHCNPLRDAADALREFYGLEED